MAYIKLTHTDIEILINSLEELEETSTPEESRVLNKLKLIRKYQARKHERLHGSAETTTIQESTL